MRTPVSIQRDSFARASLMRRRVKPGACSWCGREGRRWRYWWERDDDWRLSMRALLEGKDHAWCSVGCWRSYGGG